MVARGPAPEWRRTLEAIPPEERCPTQIALARTQSLLDTIVDTFGHPQRPPPPTTSPKARTVAISTLEIYKHSFKGTYAFSTLPPELWKAVGPCHHGVVGVCFDWANSHAACLEDPLLRPDPTRPAEESSPEATSEAICMAVSLGYWLYDPSDPHRNSEAVRFLRHAEAALAALEARPDRGAAVEAALTAAGHQLTLRELRSLSLHIRTVHLCARCAGRGITDAAKDAWEEWEDAALADGPADWILLSNYNAIVNPIVEMTDISKACAMELATRLLKRALDVAEAEDDPFRISWAAYDLGRTLATGRFQYQSMVALEKKGREGAERCRKWVPRRLREAALGSSIDVEEVLQTVQKLATPEQLADWGFQLALGNYPRYWRSHGYELTMTAHKTCAACGSRGPDLSRCSRCRAVHYCNRACQLSHFPQHKAECKRLAAERA